MPKTLPGFPPRRGVFERCAPSWFKVVVRACQGFTDNDIAKDRSISRRAVSEYKTRARDRLGFHAFQDVKWAFYEEYGGEMWPPPGDDD